MCKLVHSKSGIVNLMLTTEYVNRILAASPVTVEEKDARPSLMLMDPR